MPGPVIEMLSFVIETILNLLHLIVLVSVLISWVSPDPYNPLVQLIRNITEPLYRPFRGINRMINSPLDLAPLIVLLILTTLQRGILPQIKILLLNPT